MPPSDILLDENYATVVNRLEITTETGADSDIALFPKWATIDLGGGGGSNSDGDIKLHTQSGEPRVHFDAGGGGPKNPAANRIYLDGSTSRAEFSDDAGTTRVSVDGEAGRISLETADGTPTLQADAESGTIGFARRSYGENSALTTPMLSMFEDVGALLEYGNQPTVPVISHSSDLPRRGLLYDDERKLFLFQHDLPPEPDLDSGDLTQDVEDPTNEIRDPTVIEEPPPPPPDGGWKFEAASPSVGGSNSLRTDGSGGSESTSDDSGTGDYVDREDLPAEPPFTVLSVDLANERVGVGIEEPSHALEVEGNVKAANVSVTSDSRCKRNVEPLTDAVDTVNELDGVSYEWTDDYDASDDRHLGLLADEVADVLPEVVDRPEDGLASLAQGDLVALLVEAIKEQQADIEAKDARLDDQADRIDAQRELIEHQRERLDDQADRIERLEAAVETSGANDA